MKLPKFIQNLIDRGAEEILLSAIAERFLAFLTMILVIRILPENDYGYVAFAISCLAFLLPMSGAGMGTSLLHFASLSGRQMDKATLLRWSLRRGFWASAILYISVAVAAPWITQRLPESMWYLVLLALQFFSLFMMMMVRNYLRAIHLNRAFARMNFVYALSLFVLAVPLTYLYGALAYVLVISLWPLFFGLMAYIRFGLGRHIPAEDLTVPVKEYTSYGIFTSISNTVSVLLFSVDIILIGNMMSDPVVLAHYKAATLIPINMMFLPIVVFTTDFVRLSRQSVTEPKAVRQYYRDYLKVMIPLSLLLCVVLFFAAPLFMRLFGQSYVDGTIFFRLFILGLLGAILFRIPLGNIIAAVGWSKVNLLNSLVILVLNLICNALAIYHYGALGAAVVTTAMLWLSGLFGYIGFSIWCRRHID